MFYTIKKILITIIIFKIYNYIIIYSKEIIIINKAFKNKDVPKNYFSYIIKKLK